MSDAITNLQQAMEQAEKTRPKVGGFPYLAEALRRAGATRNDWHLPSGQCMFLTTRGPVMMPGFPFGFLNTQAQPPETGPVDVPAFDQEALVRAIRTDQAGESTLPEFLLAAWRAGVVHYVVDFIARTVTYFGCNQESYVESYPAVNYDSTLPG